MFNLINLGQVNTHTLNLLLVYMRAETSSWTCTCARASAILNWVGTLTTLIAGARTFAYTVSHFHGIIFIKDTHTHRRITTFVDQIDCLQVHRFVQASWNFRDPDCLRHVLLLFKINERSLLHWNSSVQPGLKSMGGTFSLMLGISIHMNVSVLDWRQTFEPAADLHRVADCRSAFAWLNDCRHLIREHLLLPQTFKFNWKCLIGDIFFFRTLNLIMFCNKYFRLILAGFPCRVKLFG